jgi:hypothetical protein
MIRPIGEASSRRYHSGREVSRLRCAQEPSEKTFPSNMLYIEWHILSVATLSPQVSYDKAQICSNGHIITADIGRMKGAGMEKFCSRCGAETLTSCQCGQAIRGRYWVSGQEPPYHRPSFCPECGRPYPWTQMAIDAAREYATELRLEIEQQEFADVIENLVRDTAKSSIAVSR